MSSDLAPADEPSAQPTAIVPSALQTIAEEIANSVTHGLGLLLAIAGTCVLLAAALERGDGWVIVSCAIYSATLIAVYAASTLSHAFRQPALRRRFRILDQAFIYLLIAGTCTPFSLVYLRYGWWWLLFGLMWGGALVGCLSKLLWAHRVEAVSIAMCLLLGWIPVVGARWMIGVVPDDGLWWMLIGGLSYSAGALFLYLDTRVQFFHAVWHVFVISGSICHYLAILWYAVPPASAG